VFELVAVLPLGALALALTLPRRTPRESLSATTEPKSLSATTEPQPQAGSRAATA
jgi:hypothetical protein